MKRFMKHASVVIICGVSSLSCSDQDTNKNKALASLAYVCPHMRQDTTVLKRQYKYTDLRKSSHKLSQPTTKHRKKALPSSAADDLEFGRLTAEKIAVEDKLDQTIAERDRVATERDYALKELNRALYCIKHLWNIITTNRSNAASKQRVESEHIPLKRDALLQKIVVLEAEKIHITGERDGARKERDCAIHSITELSQTIALLTEEKDATLQKIALLECANRAARQPRHSKRQTRCVHRFNSDEVALLCNRWSTQQRFHEARTTTQPGESKSAPEKDTSKTEALVTKPVAATSEKTAVTRATAPKAEKIVTKIVACLTTASSTTTTTTAQIPFNQIDKPQSKEEKKGPSKKTIKRARLRAKKKLAQESLI